jgi:MFS family permease
MLCTICIGIGTGLTERVVAGSAGAMMGGVLTTMQLLVDSAPRHHPSLYSGLHVSYWILGVAAGFLFLQLITYRWHILWRMFYLGIALMANGAMLAMVYRHHI